MIDREEIKRIKAILNCSDCEFKTCEQCEINCTDKKIIREYIEQLESDKENIYWQGYTKKQQESVEICKICKYRDKYRQLEAELSKANNTINQYKEREQNIIKYLEEKPNL